MNSGLKQHIRDEINRVGSQEPFINPFNHQNKVNRITNSVSMYAGVGKNKLHPKPGTGVSSKQANRKS